LAGRHIPCEVCRAWPRHVAVYSFLFHLFPDYSVVKDPPARRRENDKSQTLSF
jgi:hypothetical protein